jgi:epoxyqueuosine reductase
MKGAELLQSVSARGYAARLVSVKRVAELESSLHSMAEAGSLSPRFFKELCAYYNFDWQKAMPEAQSILVLAAPQMPSRVRFGDSTVIIPPTYIYRDIWEGSLNVLNGLLTPYGQRVARARLPLKLLAVRSGLGEYGRSIICFVPGLGSFHRLGAFYTDIKCGEDGWRAPRLMARCQDCLACAMACPTGAIRAESMLIEAQRCLTYLNEREADFPVWVAQGWHNALIGCMACQQACPVDRPFAKSTADDPVDFSTVETELILMGSPLAGLPEETRKKLHELCLEDDYPQVARNLGMLIKHNGPRPLPG